MEFRVLSDDGDLLRLALVGRVEQGDVPIESEPIRHFLGPRGYARTALLSLADTHFIDSRGLSWLVVCHKRFCQAGGKLVFHSATPTIRELFRLMGLDLALHLAKDEAAALELAGESTS
jgi:anti-anti-sigma factor